MRRTSLKRTGFKGRRKSIQATRWGIAYKPPRRKKRQVQDPNYLCWLHEQLCWWAGHGDRCQGRIEADHGSGKGMGQRRTDDKAIPSCVRHHREPGFASLPPWDAMTKWERKELVDQAIIQLRLAYLIREAEDATIPF